MKKAIIAVTAMLFATAQGQELGNAGYGNNQYVPNQHGTYPVTSSTQDEMLITIRGIYNEKATARIAVFSVLQLGKTVEEATNLIDDRIGRVKSDLQISVKDAEIVTDMISFVPMYTYDVEKKLFNPKTYNEKPDGFELKKNLIIKYKNQSDLDHIISSCARSEIYDLAKVDYVTSDYDHIRDVLQARAIEEFRQSLSNYSMIMGTDLSKKEKIVGEGFDVSYPMENYRSYTANASASANFGAKDVVNNIRKNTTQYYNASQLKQHTFIVNADVAEPTIQIFYDLTVRIKLKEDQLPKNTIQKNNKFYLISPAGNITLLNI